MARSRPRPGPARGVLAGALAVGLLGALVGCGTASEPSPPSGVDELTIPTPSPDPDDFGGDTGNRWVPTGTDPRWTYVVTDPTGTHRLSVDLGCADRSIDGVATTSRCSREQGRLTVDAYAGDLAGNVWWFGRDGVWEAGVDDEEPGLLMAATPRVGDGYEMGGGDVATVIAVDAEVTVPCGSYDDVVRLRVVSPTGSVTEEAYAPGVGLVREVAGARVVELDGLTDDGETVC